MHFAQQLQGAKATFPPYMSIQREKYILYQKEKTKKIKIKREKKEEKGNNLFK